MRILLFIIATTINLSTFGQERSVSASEMDSLFGFKPSENARKLDHIPVYKGCDKKASNDIKRKCISEKIALHFKKNFNTEMHEESDLEPGIKRIVLIFKIDKEGYIIDPIARAEDEYLEAEAERVVKLIPQFTPGYVDDKPVTVPYSLPLMVEIVPNKNEGKTRFPIYRGCDVSFSDTELLACSKEKIRNFIKMSYDIELASRALPTEKSTQFLLEFTINKKGKIVDVTAKANHKAIAIEAIRVAKRLPKFKAPGLWEGVAVDTPYKLLMTLYFN